MTAIFVQNVITFFIKAIKISVYLEANVFSLNLNSLRNIIYT